MLSQGIVQPLPGGSRHSSVSACGRLFLGAHSVGTSLRVAGFKLCSSSFFRSAARARKFCFISAYSQVLYEVVLPHLNGGPVFDFSDAGASSSSPSEKDAATEAGFAKDSSSAQHQPNDAARVVSQVSLLFFLRIALSAKYCCFRTKTLTTDMAFRNARALVLLGACSLQANIYSNGLE